MKKTLKLLSITLTFCFLFSGVSLACDRWIAGRCYIQDTGDPLVGVDIVITDTTQDISVTVESGTIVIDGVVYNNIPVVVNNGMYIVNFGCNLRELLHEWIWQHDINSFNIEAEATFEDQNGDTYTLVSEQYQGVEVKCGCIFLANFEYEIITSVLLSSFTAVPQNGSVSLIWETSDETDNFGFNIYRIEQGGDMVKVNDAIIYARGSQGLGAVYAFTDYDVQNRKEYMYYLEDVDIYGATAFHEPLTVVPRLIYEFVR